MHADRTQAQTDAPSASGQASLLDIWGDTVSAKHLIKSLGISITFAVGAFFLGEFVGQRVVETPQIARAISLLFGLLGCMTAGVVVAKLFKPKRTLVEEVADSNSRAEAMAILAKERGGLGSVEDLPPAVAEEMRTLGLYDVFAEAEREIKRGNQIPGAHGVEKKAGDA